MCSGRGAVLFSAEVDKSVRFLASGRENRGGCGASAPIGERLATFRSYFFGAGAPSRVFLAL
jgi:hypothetical protein